MKKKRAKRIYKRSEIKDKNNFFFSWKFFLIVLAVIILVAVLLNMKNFPLFNPGDSVTRSFNDSEIHVEELVNVTLKMISNSQGAQRTFQINEYVPNSTFASIVPCNGESIFGENPRYIKFVGDLPDGTTELCYSISFKEKKVFNEFMNSNYAFRESGSPVASGSISGTSYIVVIGPEICDGFDNDGDGQVDEGNVCETKIYCDNDTDTYFDNTSDGNCNSFNCVPTNCRAEIGDDCNDTNSSINPSKTEICDGVDNNCDGLIDNGNLCPGNGVCQLGICVQPNCNSVWVSSNDSCDLNDTRRVRWVDTNCSVAKANDIYDCDYNLNGVIGNVSNVRTLRVDGLKIYIDERRFDWSKNYTDDKYRVEFFDEDENIILSFDYDFEDDDALNLKKIYLEKQRSSSDFGYLIVDGLAEINKTILIEKIDSSSQYVCVKDKEILEIGDFSEKCTGSKEYLIKCPGNNSRYKCVVEGGMFSVLGIKNSAVKELLNFAPVDNSDDDDVNVVTTCSSQWDCSWSECVNNIQTYSCVDLNRCSGGINPATSQSPRACSSSSNNVGTGGTDTGGDDSGDTETDKGKIIFYVIIGLIIFIFIIILIIFFVQYSKKKNQGFSVPVRYS